MTAEPLVVGSDEATALVAQARAVVEAYLAVVGRLSRIGNEQDPLRALDREVRVLAVKAGARMP